MRHGINYAATKHHLPRLYSFCGNYRGTFSLLFTLGRGSRGRVNYSYYLELFETLFKRMKCRNFWQASRVKCKRSLLWKVWGSGSNDNFKTPEWLWRTIESCCRLCNFILLKVSLINSTRNTTKFYQLLKISLLGIIYNVIFYFSSSSSFFFL